MDTLEMEQRLWEYIDGYSTAEEKTVMEGLIRDNNAWRELYQALLQVHGSLALIDVEQPSVRFTKNVMEEIAKHHIAPATGAYINQKIIWGIAAFFVLALLGFLVYGLGQIDRPVSATSNTVFGVDLTKLEYGKMFDSTVINVFMMLNAILGLMLADRYLSNKRRESSEAS